VAWADRTVCVTGASRGIGRSIAQAFRGRGAKVVGTRTRPAGADDACDEWLVADFSDVAQIEACATSLAGLEIDILINCAGINKIAPFADIDPVDFLRIQQVNVFAPLRMCQAVLPIMLQRHWGRIVNISSVWGKVSKEFRASYSASKFALDGMTLALAAEHGANGILANCVSPGFIDTELTRNVLGESGIRQMTQAVPVRRLGQADEIAGMVVWLASEENTYLNGQNIAVDGGFCRV
jgi:NAD(P)-dependent dehydrogenase (short-subunit alcohol dehydrogenase family)